MLYFPPKNRVKPVFRSIRNPVSSKCHYPQGRGDQAAERARQGEPGHGHGGQAQAGLEEEEGRREGGRQGPAAGEDAVWTSWVKPGNGADC